MKFTRWLSTYFFSVGEMEKLPLCGEKVKKRKPAPGGVRRGRGYFRRRPLSRIGHGDDQPNHIATFKMVRREAERPPSKLHRFVLFLNVADNVCGERVGTALHPNPAVDFNEDSMMRQREVRHPATLGREVELTDNDTLIRQVPFLGP